MVKIDASNKDDVKLLANCFFTVPEADKWRVVAKTVDLGLTKIYGWQWLIWLLRKIHGSAGIYQFFKILSEKSPKTIDNCLEDTIIHIVNGKDRSDPTSVGGWSQKEIDFLLDNVTFSLLKERENKGKTE